MNDKGWWQRQTMTDRVLFASLGIAVAILLAVAMSSLRSTQRANERQVAAPGRQVSTAPATQITKANYERLREGMKEEEVTAILGPVGEVKFEAKEPASSSAVYQWGNARDGFIICTLGDGKLVSKTQVSLRN